MDIGQRFADYRIEGQIGRGGMGVVYEAYDVVRERRVALKVLAPSLADDEGFRARFLHEARTVAGLSSPHIVPVHDFGAAEGHLYLDMALVDGRDLAAVLTEGPLVPARAVRIVEQVADALDVAHERGLVHRDVKPGNVLLTRRRADQPDFVYLADFGLARSVSPTDGAAGLTAAGVVVGTADAMSPEQIEGRPLDARSDVYALGCLLHQCLTGHAPFSHRTDGSPASQISVLDAHRAEPVPLLPATGSWGSLDLVLATAMAKDPAHRYASAGALARAAREALAGVTTPGLRPVPLPVPVPVPVGAAMGSAHLETAAAPVRTAPVAQSAGDDSARTVMASAPSAPSFGAPTSGVPTSGVPAFSATAYAGQPSHQTSPSQRKRLGGGAIAGIVLGSLALVGLTAAGGAVALGVALASDEPTASASPSGRAGSLPSAAPASPSASAPVSPAATTAAPAAPAMVPNPALGATTSLQVDPADQAFLAALPRELNACRSEPRDVVAGHAATASVSCLATNLEGGEVYALQFADEATRDAAFAEYTQLETNTNGTCPNVDGAGPWATPTGEVGGTAACYVVADDPEAADPTYHAVIAWTVTGQPLFLVANDPWSSYLPPLVDWQQAYASDYAATIPAEQL